MANKEAHAPEHFVAVMEFGEIVAYLIGLGVMCLALYLLLFAAWIYTHRKEQRLKGRRYVKRARWPVKGKRHSNNIRP